MAPAVNRPRDLPAPASPPSHLYASSVTYEGQVIVADGTPEAPVRFESGTGRLTALHLRLDTVAQTVEAEGGVSMERQVLVNQREMRADSLPARRRSKLVSESASGTSLRFNFKTQTGKLDGAHLELANFSFVASALEINGHRYSAHNVVVRPGGLSPDEMRVYGTPPFSLHANRVEATAGGGTSGGTASGETMVVHGASLYYKNTRLMPVPAYVFQAGSGAVGRNRSAYQITPTIGRNSADHFVLTTKLTYPLSKDARSLAANGDIGISQRIGFRGGASLDSNTHWGQLSFGGRKNDIVTTQLTNRIELDRVPEVKYESPTLFKFALPGGREGGLSIQGGYGHFIERTIGGGGQITSNRSQAGLILSSRVVPVDGPYIELFANNSEYEAYDEHLRNLGFELGYEGSVGNRVRGQVSYRTNSLQGATPFRFDAVEISRELRATFDVQATKRYLVPLDFRYDLSRRAIRDETFGLLRSYKTFAYGVVYQTSREELRLEFRKGF